MTDHCSTAGTFAIARRAALATLLTVASLAGGTTASAQAKSASKKATAAAAKTSQKPAQKNAGEKRDSMTVTIAPLQRTEVKLEMTKGQKANYSWKADDADVTFNLHGEGPDAPGGKAHSYARGSSRAETGEIVALFDGVHGWSWRNTSDKPVKIMVTAWGQFQTLKQP